MSITVNENGMIFSLDAMISVVFILIGALLFAIILTQHASTAERQLTGFEFEEKALMIADSLVKNYNPENTSLGACVYDSDKKRVLTNELSFANISSAKPLSFGKIYLESISLEGKTTQRVTLGFPKKSTECLTSKRFVLVDGKKTIILVRVCKE